ncbi:NYN domain-containing protein [bacterium SCSIO 12696]|nr:NYN domain-containing protein [bacterium SCSIO 12696]
MTEVAIFVDVQNIYYTTREGHGRRFDYNRFWAQATEGREVVAAYAYAIDRGDEKQRQFQNILRAIGFEVKLKPFIQRSDGSAKGDWDVGIAIDVMDHLATADVIVLASGDGDFDLLLQRAEEQGTATEVYGVPALTAASLINSAGEFIPIQGELLL